MSEQGQKFLSMWLSNSKEMLATLLLPAGVTSSASIAFKDEEQLLKNEKDIDIAYVEKVLPQKMEYNLDGIEKF